MISALRWVKRGCAAQFPTQKHLNDEEYARIQLEITGELLNTKEENTSPEVENDVDMQAETQSLDDKVVNLDANGEEITDIYNMDDYDKPDERVQSNVFSGVKGLAYYQPEEQDPYVVLDVDDDQAELEIKETDNLLLACKTEDDVSYLEVYVYENDNLYVHHDIMLPSFPLCLEWLDYPVGSTDGNSKGNFVAIGTFEPHVEIWDLDSIEPLFPEVILGTISNNQGRIPVGAQVKKGGGPCRISRRANPERHIDAIMSISWNTLQRNLIATASADTTIKLWDIQRPSTAIVQYTHHTDKVQQVVWNPTNATILMSGGYDKKACVFDSRDPKSVIDFQLESDVECMIWDPFRSDRFLVSTEDGVVKCFDYRNPTLDIFTIHAHDLACSSMSFNTLVPGCLVTGSADKTIKVWNLSKDQPNCLISRDIGSGKVFASEFCMDSAFALAVAGSKGKVVVWNLDENASIRSNFSESVRGAKEINSKPELVVLEEDQEVDSEDGESEAEEVGDVNGDDYSDEMDADDV